MDFRILGPLEVRDDDRVIPLGGVKPRAVLAILLLRANQVVSTDRLVDELWGEQPPKTAGHTLQVFVSDLRGALAASSDGEGSQRLIVTKAPGYLIQLEPDQLDLDRFERLAEEGRLALAEGRAEAAAATLREALAIWRGPPLADLAYEAFAQAAITRLDELRLAALEDRIEADLTLGMHRELVAELQTLVGEHPLRERCRGQLMLSLYRSDRQAEALQAYQEARQALVAELGIEPSRVLKELELAILRQDETLAPEQRPRPEVTAPDRSILVAPGSLASLDQLLAVAEPLTRRPRREIIIGAVIGDPSELGSVTAELEEVRQRLVEKGASTRVAAFTSNERGADLVRFASEQDVDFLLVDAPRALLAEGVTPTDLAKVWESAPCDVGVLVAADGGSISPLTGRPILVPFGGGEHEWAAVEVGAWLAAVEGATLRLLGSAARRRRAKRDASRLLAGVSLITQRAAGVPAEPLLVPPGEEPVLAASEDAGLLVLGLSDRWSREGLDQVRLNLARRAQAPTLLVRRGLRPSGLTPHEGMSRYTWSLDESLGSG